MWKRSMRSAPDGGVTVAATAVSRGSNVRMARSSSWRRRFCSRGLPMLHALKSGSPKASMDCPVSTYSDGRSKNVLRAFSKCSRSRCTDCRSARTVSARVASTSRETRGSRSINRSKTEGTTRIS